MKRKHLLPVFITLSVAFAVGILRLPSLPTPVEKNGDTLACTNYGPRQITLSQVASAHSSQQSDCEEKNIPSAEKAAIRQTLTLHQNAGDMYIKGSGYSVDVPLEVGVHILSQGALGAPYTILAHTDGADSFVSQSMHVVCPDDGAQIYVIATDRTGSVHARVFNPGEFRC